jgi:hypothetical protein
MRGLFVMVLLGPLCGCIVTGTQPNTFNITIDNSLTPAIAQEFAKAHTLAMPVTIELDVQTASAFEDLGHYQVTVDRELGGQGNVLLDSERRAMLQRLCQKSKPDIALTISYDKANARDPLFGAFIGREVVNFHWHADYLSCRSGSPQKFGGTFSYDAGVFNQDVKSTLTEKWAQAMVTTLDAAFGR